MKKRKINNRPPGLPSTHKFYVYELIDPRTREVFYVGCGSGARWRTSASHSMSESRHKRQMLDEIRSHGLRPLARVVSSFVTRRAALAAEREHQWTAIGHRTVASEAELLRQNVRAKDRSVHVQQWCGQASGYAQRCPVLPAFFGVDAGRYPVVPLRPIGAHRM